MGHVMLPLATVEAYQRVVPHLDVLFLAGAGGPAATLVPAAGHRLVVVRASALRPAGPMGKAAADHQAVNARAFAATGAALLTREADRHESRLAGALQEVWRAPGRWQQMANSARRAARPGAATAIADDCERVMQGLW